MDSLTFKQFLELAGVVGGTIQGGSGQTGNDGTYSKQCRSRGKVRSKFVAPDEMEDSAPCKSDGMRYAKY